MLCSSGVRYMVNLLNLLYVHDLRQLGASLSDPYRRQSLPNTNFFSHSPAISRTMRKMERAEMEEATANKARRKTFLVVAVAAAMGDRAARDLLRQTWVEWGKRLQLIMTQDLVKIFRVRIKWIFQLDFVNLFFLEGSLTDLPPDQMEGVLSLIELPRKRDKVHPLIPPSCVYCRNFL